MSTLTKLRARNSTHRQAALPKTTRPRTETTMETANELNLVRRQVEMAMRHIVAEVVGSTHVLCVVVESSFLLLSSAQESTSLL